jgi:cell division protein FtsW (lipid II flippase)
VLYLNTDEFLNNVCNEIKYKPVTASIKEELQTHIEDIKQDKINLGYNDEEAEKLAVDEMGNPKEIGKKLNKIHKPKLEWKILLLASILVLIKIFFNFKQYIGKYSSWSMSKDIFFIIIGLILGVAIYFFNYTKAKKISNFIFVVATGIIIFQWINWKFNIDSNILENLNSTFGYEKNTLSIFNMRLWYISIVLYIISFAGNLTSFKKPNLIILYIVSVLLVFLQSGSITNSIILIMAYLFMLIFKMTQNNVKIKNIAINSFIILFMSIGVILLLECLNIKIFNIHTGNSVEKYYSESSEYIEEKNNLLSNLKLFGESKNIYFTNTNSQFLQILASIGIIPSITLVCFIILMSVVLIKDSLKIQDTYGKFLIVGLSTLYIVQSFAHIFMNLNLLPVSDVNLPFLSNGNLFFIINTVSFAIIMSVYRRKNLHIELFNK